MREEELFCDISKGMFEVYVNGCLLFTESFTKRYLRNKRIKEISEMLLGTTLYIHVKYYHYPSRKKHYIRSFPCVE